jgi:tripartite ATP-independent transporter DctP family solute receptor
MMKRVVVFWAILALTVSLGGVQADAKAITLKLGHVTSAVEPIHQAFEFYAKSVAERTNGDVKIEVYPNAALGTNKEMYEQARMGANVIANVDPGYLSDYVPDLGVMNGPYLVVDPKDFNKILESDWYKDVEQKVYDEGGFKILTLNMFFGPRNIITDKPVRTLEDIKGLSIRCPPNVMWIETFKALGANPTTLAWAEVYSGLAQGVVDAAEAPLGSLWGAKLYESKKVISMTGHFKAFVGMAIGRTYWDTLPADVQQILLEEAKKAGDFLTDLTIKSQEEFKKKFEAEGVTFVEDIDFEAFQKATESVYQAFPEWTPGLHDTIKAILAQ